MKAALCCHGLCLSDSFWIRETGETVSYDQISLFDNLSPGEYVDVVLRDRSMVAQEHKNKLPIKRVLRLIYFNIIR